MSAKAKPQSFTAEERAAMKQRAKELKENASKSQALEAVLAKIAEMDSADRTLAEQIHAIVTKAAPGLAPKLWYGSPAYARDGVVVCFFQESAKFNTRYATLGFSDAAQLDDGSFWPTAYALTKLTAADEKKVSELVKRAAG